MIWILIRREFFINCKSEELVKMYVIFLMYVSNVNFFFSFCLNREILYYMRIECDDLK